MIPFGSISNRVIRYKRGLSLTILGNRENVDPPTTEQEYGHMDKRRRH